MSNPCYQSIVHRTALATTCLALLPIIVGALVTSMGAGMAFADWPSSDGEFMLTYPWFSDLIIGAKDKFVEHGHRLAGMLIGLASIALVAVLFRKEPRVWVKMLGLAVLLCVIAQGILGGMRVLANRADFAMFHGNFAALVFTLMASVSLVTSRQWYRVSESNRFPELGVLKPLAFLTTAAIYGQYILGGRQRHLHDMLHEHLGAAFAVFLLVVVTSVFAHRSKEPWLKRSAWTMFFLVLTQATLGLGAWVTKFGFPPTGYVAVQDSTLQLFVRSSHTVVGMLLLMSSVMFILRLLRIDARRQEHRSTAGHSLASPVSLEGGAG
ncbi:MAG: COX15/CtaA family protein [Planctomycetaceae bacterium]